MDDLPDWLTVPPEPGRRPLGERLSRAGTRFTSLLLGVLGTAAVLLGLLGLISLHDGPGDTKQALKVILVGVLMLGGCYAIRRHLSRA